MKKQITAENETPRVIVLADRDLEIRGRDSLEISAETNRAEDLQFELAGDVYRVECRHNLSLELPRGAQVLVERAGGDATITDLVGLLQIERVSGDLTLRRCALGSVDHISGDCSIEAGTGPFTLQHVNGDLDVDGLNGDFQVEGVNGDCSLAQVAGAALAGQVSGDFEASGIRGDLSLGNVSGDTQISQVEGEVRSERTSGDFSADRTGPITFMDIGGDASLAQCSGAVSGRKVGGDLAINSAAGRTDVEQVGGDTTLKGQALGASLKTGGDIAVVFQGALAGQVHLTAGGDLVCNLPDPAEAQVEVFSSGEITIRLADQHLRVSESPVRFRIGQGTFPVYLKAGGSAVVKGSAGQSAEFEGSLEDDLNNLAENITRDVMGKAAWTNERAYERARAATERMNERMRAALNRLERRGIRMPDSFREPFLGRVPGPMDPPAPPAPVWPGTEADQPAETSLVSDEERMLILRMVQEKKISVEQAEELLQALEGGE